jgi:hypothetical protein
MTAGAKFRLASKDSFDWGSFIVGGVFAAVGQLSDQYPSFGQGMKGYGKRLAGGYADQVIGNYFGEALIPIAFHQDPRYFRLARGGGRARVWYAITRVAVTRTDSGGDGFNYGEFLGNLIGSGISNAYYPPEDRSVSQTLKKAMFQTGTDAGFNVLKEFWPDIRRRIFKHRSDQ